MDSEICKYIPWILSSITPLGSRIIINRSRYLRLCSDYVNEENCIKALENFITLFKLQEELAITIPGSNTITILDNEMVKRAKLSELIKKIHRLKGDISRYITRVIIGGKELELNMLDYMLRQCKKYKEVLQKALNRFTDLRVSYRIMQHILDSPELFDEQLFLYALFTALNIGAEGYTVHREYSLNSVRIDILVIADQEEGYRYSPPFKAIVIEVKQCKKRRSLSIAGQIDPVSQLERYVNAVKAARPDLTTVLGLIITNCVATRELLIELIKRNEEWKERGVRLDILDRDSIASVITHIHKKTDRLRYPIKPFLHKLLEYIMNYASVAENKLRQG